MIKTHHSNAIEVPIACSIPEEVQEYAGKWTNQFNQESIGKVIII